MIGWQTIEGKDSSLPSLTVFDIDASVGRAAP